jgi:hypothetical protein
MGGTLTEIANVWGKMPPRHPRPQTSQGRVRKTAIADVPRSGEGSSLIGVPFLHKLVLRIFSPRV